MRTEIVILLALAASACSPARPVVGEIRRVGAPQSPILTSVEVPAGSRLV